ncbi:hypothetical protein [Ornithinimicrobium murale]|uniref:hypothetical protein n=1 Tax=Ornithinimicrobium murale TaxID=1050153 RepID=UPI000E0DEDEF|nr:hypothetical protein [Ornithinimicrobium murale]
MATEGSGREDRPDDADDIDARFEEIVSGLRAEQQATQQQRREALRRAQQQRRTANRPLEGFDDPNPWPPGSRRSDATPTEEPTNAPAADGTNPPWSDPSTPSPEPPTGQPPAARGGEPPHTPEPAEPAWRGWEESDEEEHFIPPTPPLPAGDLHLWAIVVGLLGGPILLILSSVFRVLDSGWWTTLGILLSVGGVVLLFLRLPKHRDDTDSSGGAQV